MTRKTRVWLQLAAFAIALFSAEVAAIPRVAEHATAFIANDPAASVARVGRILARDLGAFTTAGASWVAGSVATHPCASPARAHARHRRARAIQVECAPVQSLKSVANIVAIVLS